MMVVYYGFILLVAFDKPFLAQRLGSGVTTVGMPIGVGVIVFTIVITGDLRAARQQRVRRADRADRQGSAEMSRRNRNVATLVKIVALAALASAGAVALAAGADLGQAEKQPTNWTAIGMFAVFVRLHARSSPSGRRRKTKIGGRLLHRRRRHHRLPERPGDRRRLHVGGVVPRHLGRGDGQRLRRPDLLDRLPGRLAGHHLPDGRAAAQPRQVHLRRRGRATASARRRSASSPPRARWSSWPST